MSVLNLDCLFRPRSIALLGADRWSRSIGSVLATNLFKGGFGGPVMPVHATDAAVQGVLAYRSAADLPMVPDLAVIASPPPEIPPLIAALGARGTRAAVIVSHDFDAEGPTAGAALRQAMLDAAKPFRLRIVGPACLGVMVPEVGLDASYAHISARQGDLAFVSQSGSLMTLMLDWAGARGVGFSLVCSLGDRADVDFGDMLDYLAFDADSRAVLLCIDTIAKPRKFMSAARAAARLKPVIVYDAGRLNSAAGTAAAIGEPSPQPSRALVYDAAFRRAGLLPVPTLADLVAAAGTLGSGIKMSGDRLAVLGNGRGISEVTGELVLQEGGRLAQLSPATLEALDRVLPGTWGRRNPVNLFCDASAARWCDAVGPLLADGEVDAVVAVNAPTATGDTLEAANALAGRLAKERKPVAAVWLEDSTLDEARRVFSKHRISMHDGPGQAVEALMQLVRYRRNQEMLMQTPASLPTQFEHHPERARGLVRAALDEGREWLSEPEAKGVLAAYGLPVLGAEDCASETDAVAAAERLGYPVSLRPCGLTETGEASVGSAGVSLHLETPEAVAAAARRLLRKHVERQPNAPFPGFTVRAQPGTDRHHELQLGISCDPLFGPLVLFGLGGDVARVIPDRAVGLPPLNLSLAHMLIAETRAQRLLQGYGDRPAANLEEIALALVKLSQGAAEIAEVVEIDINPLLARADGVLVIAARMRVARVDHPAEARLAIRPYPNDLEKTVVARDGRNLLIRPIRPEDEPAFQEFVRRQSPEDRRLRFFTHVKQLDHRMAARLTQIDYDREMALVLIDPQASEAELLGVMRISADPDQQRAEYAGAVRSDLKGLGFGRLLLEEIIEYCRRRGIAEVCGEVLAENTPMLSLARKLGFSLETNPEDPSVITVRKLLREELAAATILPPDPEPTYSG